MLVYLCHSLNIEILENRGSNWRPNYDEVEITAVDEDADAAPNAACQREADNQAPSSYPLYQCCCTRGRTLIYCEKWTDSERTFFFLQVGQLVVGAHCWCLGRLRWRLCVWVFVWLFSCLVEAIQGGLWSVYAVDISVAHDCIDKVEELQIHGKYKNKRNDSQTVWKPGSCACCSSTFHCPGATTLPRTELSTLGMLRGVAFKKSHFIGNWFGCNFGCDLFRIMPEIISKLLSTTMWRNCPVWLDLSNFSSTGRQFTSDAL